MKNGITTDVKSIGCIADAVEIFDAKWSAHLIRTLGGGPKRYCELQREIDGINPRVLTQRLSSLEEKGITTVVCGCTPQRPIYELTEKGRGLLPILEAMAIWGQKYSR